MVWTKGKQCGVDNCQSQFYEILNGRRVCQNNHIQEGLETAGDDDDYVAIGQRIRQPRALKNRGGVDSSSACATTLRGVEAKQLLCQCLQIVYQHQLRFVIKQYALDPSFEHNARELWACFLSVYQHLRFGLLHLVALVYLATRRANDLVLVSDLVRFISLGKFPYLESYRLLPQSDYRKLPSDLRKYFMPSVGKTQLRLYEQVWEIKQKLQRGFSYLEFGEIPLEYVCFRFVTDFFLPPPVYGGALRILKQIPKAARRQPQSAMMSEEIPGLCAVLVAAKLYWGLDHPDLVNSGPKSLIKVDLGLWEDMLRKLWLIPQSYTHIDERLVHNWSGDQIDDYLAWYSQTLTVPSLDKNIRACFPVPDIPTNHTPELPSPDVLSELCELLYTVPAGNKAPEITGRGGENYCVYSTRSEDMPSPLRVLYEVVERTLNTDAELVRKLVRGFELRVRSAFAETRW